jgi:hypothetical protein
VIVPPQVYFERRQQGEFEGSFLDFYPHFFDGVYPEGNFSWHHLWFLAYVLVLTFVLLPLLLWMRSEKGAMRLDRWSTIAARYHLVWLLAALVFLAEIGLLPVTANVNGLVGDWYGLTFYGLLMLAGALLYRSPALLQSLERQRFAALAVGIVAYAILEAVFFSGHIRRPYDRAAWFALCALSAVNIVAWLITIAGFARRWARPTAFLRYATPAVYPFYIMHQTVTVIFAFYLTQSDLPVVLKFLATAIVTFGVTALIYEFVVRRVGVLRPLFGMAPKRAGAGAPFDGNAIAAD